MICQVKMHYNLGARIWKSLHLCAFTFPAPLRDALFHITRSVVFLHQSLFAIYKNNDIILVYVL